MATQELTEENFESVIENNDIVIIDFWAPWCGPCRGFAPVFEKASEEHEGVVFAKVNTEEQPGLARAFQIRAIPTLMAFRDRIILFSNPGALAGGQFNQLVEQIKSIDMDKVREDIAAREAGDASPAG